MKKHICKNIFGRNITATNPIKSKNKLGQLIANKSLGFFGKILLYKTSQNQKPQNDKRDTNPHNPQHKSKEKGQYYD